MDLAEAAAEPPAEPRTHTVIEQARGILMARRDCTAAGALAVLQTAAHDSGATVHAVAVALVDEVEARARHRQDELGAGRPRVSSARTPGS
jgi:AmiR/NasT family two-component response regulator